MALDERVLKAIHNSDVTQVLGWQRTAVDTDPQDEQTGIGYLHKAVALNANGETTSILIELGCDVWAQDKRGYLPLHFTAMYPNNTNSRALAELFVREMRLSSRGRRRAFNTALKETVAIAHKEKNDAVLAAVASEMIGISLKKSSDREDRRALLVGAQRRPAKQKTRAR